MDEQTSRYSISGQKNTPKRDQMVYDDSSSLSSIPPILKDSHNEKVEKFESISEHLSSNSDSVENDRSYQEIEVTNRAIVLGLPVSDGELAQNFQETPNLSDTSTMSDNSIISLNYLKNLEHGDDVRSILDEISQNDQLQSHKEDTISNSMGESLNVFANLDLDDKSLSNIKFHNDISVEEKNLYARNFSPDKNESVLEKRIKDFEELIAIKDGTIAVLTSELDSLRDTSNTNTVSTLSTTEYKQLQEEYHTKRPIPTRETKIQMSINTNTINDDLANIIEWGNINLLLECNGVIVHKNDLIQQLIESLNQSVSGRKELLVQINRFKNEIIELQKQLQDTTNAVEMHQCGATKKSTNEVDYSESAREIEFNLEKSNEDEESIDIVSSVTRECSCLHNTRNLQQQHVLNDLMRKFNESLYQYSSKYREIHEQTLESTLQFDNEKKDLEGEVDKLRNLLAKIEGGSTALIDLKNEMEAKHAIEMEELRTYFEKKCVDLEKKQHHIVSKKSSFSMYGKNLMKLW